MAAVTIGLTTSDPNDPVGAMLFQTLGMAAEFEVAMNRERTREEVTRAKAEGKYKGRQPNLSSKDAANLQQMHASGGYTVPELGRFFGLPLGDTATPILTGPSADHIRKTRVSSL